MAGTTLHSLLYKVSTSADLKGLVATKAELAAAGRIAKETQTKTEQYSTSVAALNALHRKSALDAETHRRAIDQLGKEYKEAGAASKLLGGAGGTLGALGIGLGVGAGVSFLKSSIAAADEAAVSEARLGAVLRATGNATGFTRDQMLAYSSSLQELTGISDELFTDAQAELSTFGNIHGSVFKEAIKLSADLSRVFKTDLKQEVEGLGRALSNPLEAVDRLRIGKEKLTSAEKDLIKEMAAAGDVLGAQQAILDIVAGKVGGAAEAMRSPLMAAKEDFNNLQEAIGGLVTSTGILGKLTDAVVRLEHAASGKALTDLSAWEPDVPRKPDKIDEDFGPLAPFIREWTGWNQLPAKEAIKGRTAMGKVSEVKAIEKEKEREFGSGGTAKELEDSMALERKMRKEIADKREAAEVSEVKRLRGLRSKVDIGELNRRDDETALDALGKIEMKRDKRPPRDAGAAGVRGSQEAFSTIVRGMSRGGDGDVPKKQLTVAEQQKQIAAEQLAVAKTAAAKPPVPIQVMTF